MCAGFAAHGAPDCPAESAIGSHQCHSLQCSLVHGSGRLQLGGKCQRDQATEQPSRDNNTKQPSRDNNTNELRDQPAPDRTRREGEVKVVVCVYCWGRQFSAILSHPADSHTIIIKLRRGWPVEFNSTVNLSSLRTDTLVQWSIRALVVQVK